MTTLPVVVPKDCEGCCACCMEQGSPPGYVPIIFSPESWPRETGDHARLAAAPEAAKCALTAYILEGMEEDGGPCCWLNQETGQCRWYEHRPSICRNFDVGSPECLGWREEIGHV